MQLVDTCKETKSTALTINFVKTSMHTFYGDQPLSDDKLIKKNFLFLHFYIQFIHFYSELFQQFNTK